MKIFCLLATFFSVATAAELLQTNLIDLKPTQKIIGLASAEKIYTDKFKDVTTVEELDQLLNTGNSFKAAKGPKSEIYLTDGHHRIVAALKTLNRICQNQFQQSKQEQDYKQCLSKMKVNLSIDNDYSKLNKENFYLKLFSDGNCFISKTLRANNKSLAKKHFAKKIEKELPNSFAELSDYPLRSALGDFFYTLKEKVKGEHFENYFEFLLAETIEDEVSIKSGEEFTTVSQEAIFQSLFKNEKKIKNFRCLARKNSPHWELAQRSIDAAIEELSLRYKKKIQLYKVTTKECLTPITSNFIDQPRMVPNSTAENHFSK
ncbi:MAG: hypothetical protein L6Q37_08625 [Bdellovibrionaceae bacterium]|nr:hypothetical protein [Pseudobdellovibrionaceae bacterium]NUM58062.1 hypothetical protein [Pseudobdellovibrionaceae bacterium]